MTLEDDNNRLRAENARALELGAPLTVPGNHPDSIKIGSQKSGPPKLPRCPDPSGPGTFIVRRRKGGMLSLAEVRRNKDGCLEVHMSGWCPVLISVFPAEAKWWGPVELKR